MKNHKYYVLKTVYKLSRKNNNSFVSKDSLLSQNCPESILSYLNFYDFLEYKRENKTDYYNISQQGIDYIIQCKRENFNINMSLIAAIASVIAVIIAIFELFQG